MIDRGLLCAGKGPLMLEPSRIGLRLILGTPIIRSGARPARLRTRLESPGGGHGLETSFSIPSARVWNGRAEVTAWRPPSASRALTFERGRRSNGNQHVDAILA